ncbi:protein OSB3, chloroplastic/mitochondrial-like [Cajanus cajan]|uniref:protein OSB3, chloroplastic/mitochondrial-like n=1 Tax=Cajanus cajan TaxID=3821 RepID=UPI00098D9312|nr:protein OSB3, chloroplastic/mitochondrial-like [Cajanus cajan]
MALEQAVAVSSSSTFRNLPTFRKTPITKPQFQIPSLFCKTQRFKGNVKLKCSMTTAYPKPSEIPWKKELCNSVSLIGVVAAPLELKHLPSGKVVAWTRLSVKKNATQASSISLTFWDDLAHVASHHLHKGHQIHVSGRLVTDAVETDDGNVEKLYYNLKFKLITFLINVGFRNFLTFNLQNRFGFPG